MKVLKKLPLVLSVAALCVIIAISGSDSRIKTKKPEKIKKTAMQPGKNRQSDEADRVRH